MKTRLLRDCNGRIRNSVPRELVARMFADYKRTGSLAAAGRLHDRRGATIWRLLVDRGFITPRPRRLLKKIVDAMYADYAGGMSLEQVGDKWKRTRQSVYDTFKRRWLQLRAKEFLPAIEYKGRRYTAQLTGSGRSRWHRYLRDTVRRRGRPMYLHHVIWTEHNGPIPPGYKVCFKDGNHLNCAIENLELLTNSEQVSKYATGANQFTSTAKARLDLLLAGNSSTASALKRRAA
jgi:hypothetical protein